MAVSIRRAQADDASFLAWVMLAASRAHLPRGAWDLLIGTHEMGCLDYLRRLAVAEPRSLCHYESFWVAEVDGHLGAALCGFEIRTGGWAIVGQAMASVQRDLGWTEADVADSRNRVAPIWACFLPDIGADWGIENVASRPEFRRRGLANVLLERALREGTKRGCRLAEITTFIGNDAAQSVYKRSGFEFSDEKRCSEMASVLNAPGFVRVIRRL
jgi:ribosomal protein S18 acetylase RimI-like enzyme